MLEAIWVFLGLIVVSGLMYALATYVFGRGEDLAPMPPDATPMVLPETRALNGNDIRRVRLPVSVRGYRMSDVDLLLDRVADELDQYASRRAVAADGAGKHVAPPPTAAGGLVDVQPDGTSGAVVPPTTSTDGSPDEEPVHDWVPRRWKAPADPGEEPDHDWVPRRWEPPQPLDQQADHQWAPGSPDEGLERLSPPADRPPRPEGQPGSAP